MKILIDECVPRPITKLLAGHEAKTVQEIGWGAYSNGELLKLAEGIFDFFIIIAAVQAIQPADFVELALPWVK